LRDSQIAHYARKQAQLDTTTGAPRGRNVAQASSPASSGGVSPPEPANSRRDAAQTRSRDGCATVAVPNCALFVVKHVLEFDPYGKLKEYSFAEFGGAPVSTWGMRQRRHAEDDALASLIIASKLKS
jgi:hypothetical protein